MYDPSVIRLALALLLWLSPALATAQELPLDEVKACSQLVVPEDPRVWTIQLTTRERDGSERLVRGNVFTRQDEQGRRVIVARMTRPEELRDSTVMLLEREGGNEVFVQTPDLEKPKRVSGDEGGSISLFGTDFSYQDLARLYGLNRPGEKRRLSDTITNGRPVYVLQSKPAGGPEASAYALVISHIDKDTCVPLRTELYARDRLLRKVLTVNPKELHRENARFIAHDLRMSDLLDGSETRLLILSQAPATTFPDLPIVPAQPTRPESPASE